MKVTVDKHSNLELTEVFNPITLITEDGEKLTICMRDSGFEFFYGGIQYSAQKGKIKEL